MPFASRCDGCVPKRAPPRPWPMMQAYGCPFYGYLGTLDPAGTAADATGLEFASPTSAEVGELGTRTVKQAETDASGLAGLCWLGDSNAH